MRVRRTIIAVLILSSFLVSFLVLALPRGLCDLPEHGLGGLDIEGAHIVSEGAYFRFWIFNNNSFTINATINGADVRSISPGSGIDYNVVAPRISVPYEQVTYKFLFTARVEHFHGLWETVNFTVLVLNSCFVQVFNLLVPISIVITVIAVALVVIVIVRRRRSQKKT